MRKIFAVALTALTVFGGSAMLSSEAEAGHRHRGAAIGMGIALGLGVVAAGIAHSQAYAVPRRGGRCFEVDRFNRRGYFIGTEVVCRGWRR